MKSLTLKKQNYVYNTGPHIVYKETSTDEIIFTIK